MDSKTMVETNLTKEMIDAGTVLIRKLDEHRLNPNAAFWLYDSEGQRWKFVIAESDVATLGPKEVYRKIQHILSDSADEIAGLSLEDISLAKLDAPIIALLRVGIQTGPGISGIRFKNNVINGTLIEDAFIYRLN
jgi:hypothetical protein